MRICIVSAEYPPVTPYFGGIGSQYGRLAPAVAALGHDVHVVTLAPSSEAVPTVIDGVTLHLVQPPRVWPWYSWLYAGRVQRALREHGPFDVILAAEFAGEASRYARAQVAGPLLTHLLTSSAQLIAWRPGLSVLARKGPRAQINMALERAQTSRSVAVSAPSQAVLDVSRERWPEIGAIDTLMVPLSTDLDAVRRAAEAGRVPGAFPSGVPTVTLASRLDDHKGGQFLIAALKRIWPSQPEVRLVFVGREGQWNGRPIRGHLQELAGEDRERIVFLGEQDSEHYFGAVAASTIVAIPSLWESFCLAGLEAMGLERPLVGTRGHGFDAFVRDGENGVLVERRDIDGLTAALARLLADEALRARLGAEGLVTARAHDVEHVAPLYVDAFARTAAIAGSRGSTSSSRSGPRLRSS